MNIGVISDTHVRSLSEIPGDIARGLSTMDMIIHLFQPWSRISILRYSNNFREYHYGQNNPHLKHDVIVNERGPTQWSALFVNFSQNYIRCLDY